MDKTSELDELLAQFAQVATAFDKLADRVEKEGHANWITEALSNESKISQADTKTNIVPVEAWKQVCAKLKLPFEYIPRGTLNG